MGWNSIEKTQFRTGPTVIGFERPEREKISREEAIKRVKAFAKRKEKLVAAIRKDTR